MLRERKAVPAHGVYERAPHLPVDAGHVDAFDHHVAAVPAGHGTRGGETLPWRQ